MQIGAGMRAEQRGRQGLSVVGTSASTTIHNVPALRNLAQKNNLTSQLRTATRNNHKANRAPNEGKRIEKRKMVVGVEGMVFLNSLSR